MKRFWKRFWHEEDGIETIEVVVIIAILVAVALVFRKGIIKFVTDLMDKFFKVDAIPDVTDPGQ